MVKIYPLYYGGKSYRLFGSKYLTIWISDYRGSTVVKHKLSVDVYSRLWGNKCLIEV